MWNKKSMAFSFLFLCLVYATKLRLNVLLVVFITFCSSHQISIFGAINVHGVRYLISEQEEFFSELYCL